MYDITILYTRNGHGTISNKYKPPTLLDIFASAEPITVIVYVKIRSVSRIPTKEKARKVSRTFMDTQRESDLSIKGRK